MLDPDGFARRLIRVRRNLRGVRRRTRASVTPAFGNLRELATASSHPSSGPPALFTVLVLDVFMSSTPGGDHYT